MTTCPICRGDIAPSGNHVFLTPWAVQRHGWVRATERLAKVFPRFDIVAPDGTFQWQQDRDDKLEQPTYTQPVYAEIYEGLQTCWLGAGPLNPSKMQGKQRRYVRVVYFVGVWLGRLLRDPEALEVYGVIRHGLQPNVIPTSTDGDRELFEQVGEFFDLPLFWRSDFRW
jgi:hypothetical protein